MAKTSYSFREDDDIINVLQKINPEADLSELVREAIRDYIESNKHRLNIDYLDSIDVIDSLDTKKEFFSVTEVAKIFQKDNDTIRKWCQKNWIKAKKLGGNWVIHRSIIETIHAALRPRVARVSDKLISDCV